MDLSFFSLFYSLAGRIAFLDWIGIFLGVYLGYALVALFLFLLFSEKKWKARYYFFSLSALSVLLSRGIVVELIRFFYARPRPFTELGFSPLISEAPYGSFPSGHASFFFALAMTVYLFLKMKDSKENQSVVLRWSTVFFAGALLIGIGRIFAGVHWPSDIAGGAVIGVLSAVAIYKILPIPHNFRDAEK